MPRRHAITQSRSSPTKSQSNSIRDVVGNTHTTVVKPLVDSSPPKMVVTFPSEPVAQPFTSPTPSKPTDKMIKPKTIVRPLKYHQTAFFHAKERAVSSILDTPWYIGTGTGESYRLAATVTRSVHKAVHQVQPISWGYGTQDGTLGLNNSTRIVNRMRKLPGFRGQEIRQVSAGNKLSLLLTAQGEVLQCGRLTMEQDGVHMWKARHIKCEGGVKMKRVEAGHLAAYAINEQGHVYAWGTDLDGQLGHGESLDEFEKGEEHNTNQQDERDEDVINNDDADNLHSELVRRRKIAIECIPRCVQALYDIPITKLSAGNHYVLALSSTGHVYSWGRNTNGQLGHPNTTKEICFCGTPKLISTLNSFVVVDLSAGHSHALVVSHVRAKDSLNLQNYRGYTFVLAWGRDSSVSRPTSYGCLGMGELGPSTNLSAPHEITFFRGLHATRVAAGFDHSLVMCSTGSRCYLYSFGGNHFGQLGVANGVDGSIPMPTLVEEMSNLVLTEIVAGAYVSAALTGDGYVYTWGDGSYGKTARVDGRTTFVPWRIGSEEVANTTSISTPSELGVNDGFVTQLSMKAHHSLALFRTEGTMDRQRRYIMGNILSSAPLQNFKDEVMCVCDSAQCTTTSIQGILICCQDCQLGPLCRHCSRQCHIKHTLIPKVFGLDETEGKDAKGAKTTQIFRCACGIRRPPAPSSREHKTVGEDGSEYCRLTKLPSKIPEGISS